MSTQNRVVALMLAVYSLASGEVRAEGNSNPVLVGYRCEIIAVGTDSPPLQILVCQIADGADPVQESIRPLDAHRERAQEGMRNVGATDASAHATCRALHDRLRGSFPLPTP